MSMIKKIVAGKIEVIDTSCEGKAECRCSFPKGTKFSIDGKYWVVSLVERSDDIDFRTIVETNSGDSEIRTLKSLLQDVKEGIIKI